MSRIHRLFLAMAALAGVVTMASPTAHAASGDVVTTTVTLPAAVQGLASAAFVSARDGGMYYAYVSGNDYLVFKTKPNGTQDTSFGVGGIATLTTGISSQKRFALTSAPNGKWWASVTFNNFDVMVYSGTATGAPSAPFTVLSTTMSPWCASAYSGITASSWTTNNHRPYARRDGGLWLKIDCTPKDSNQSTIVGENLGLLIAMNATGVRDTNVALVPTHANYSSSSPCYSASVLSDPTSVAPAPEIYLVRTEHNINTPSTSTCASNQGYITAAGITGYSVVSVLADGTATSKSIASAGDATDGILAARLDPGSRIVTFNTNLADTSTISVRRIKTDGTLDTTVGTNGVSSLSVGAAPAGQASVTASAVGIITTPTKVYFSVMLSDSMVSSYVCSNTTSNTWGYRMAVVSPTDGLLSTYGTNGVGTRTTVVAPQNTICTGSVSGGGSVDTDGQPRLIRYSSNTTYLDVWTAPAGANGGGEGGTGSGGATTDTGGAPSKGDGLSVLTPATTTTTTTATTTTTTTVPKPVIKIDNTVYPKLPANVGANTALHVLSSAQAKSQVLISRTPKVCFTLTTSVVVTAKGTCTVAVKSKSNNSVLRTMTSKSVATATPGTAITTSESVTFSAASWKLSATANAQIAQFVTKANASSRIVVVGHAGSLYDNNDVFNQRISLFRAAAVKAALQKAGVKTAISVVAQGSDATITSTKTETAQAQNRRVVLYFFPQ